jgi:hypothetical protein
MVFIAISMFLMSCGILKIAKIKPEYTGVDPQLQSYVNEFIELAKIHDIRFYNKVTVGFKKVNEGNIIGVCHYGAFFREVDIDMDFWQNANEMDRLSLIFHELTHCYCERRHDFGKNDVYPKNRLERYKAYWRHLMYGDKSYGYLKDGCPKSLMHPSLLDARCMYAHYDVYVAEMFERCDPW